MAVKRQIVAGVASLAALYIGVSHALGLGDVELKSALNQPLNAVIEIPGSQGIHAEDVRVGLASSEAFDAAGVERSHFLTGLRFTPVDEGGGLTIRVQSDNPVREPYLNFLVELRQPTGRILREYTLLLDPPQYNPLTGRVATPAAAPPRRQTVTTSPEPAPVAAELPDLSPAGDASRYTTQPGDTLWDIARNQRPDERADIRQTMLAIRALNPQAFVAGDINRLRQRQELVLPTADQLGLEPALPGRDTADATDSVGPAEARSQGASSGLTETGEADGDTDSLVSERPQSPVDRLRIEALPEVTSDTDTQGMQQRMAALESRFNVLLSELEDRDRQIAMLQAELEVLRAARSAEEDAAAAGVIAAGSMGGPDQDGPSSPTGSDNPDAGSINAEPLPVLDESTADAPVAASQGGWSAWLWAPLVTLVAFLLGLLVSRRRDSEAPEPVTDAPAAPASTEPRMLARPVKPQEPPRAAVDPLDGVELYLTYGRFAEARVMLDKAISDDPQRLELRYKQLRVLGELTDADSFNALAADTLERGGEAEAIDQIRARFPAMQQTAAEQGDQVEKVDHLEPLLNEDALDIEAEVDDEPGDEGQMNLNDFSLDPDWDLIDALEPESSRKVDAEKKSAAAELDEDFESSLDRLPEVEELHDHDTRDQKQKEGSGR
ncbi:type IV pilus assembly protein FimV [Halopseudomonas salegens]|uniref:Pilus assembly protein FimV n=1 Tax=Halopseudomonas salegens TaxID=1434072 RepID=A0A1H2EU41_9GAMM|nr:FimV/HubP family polar landmark protein [Halopseudomonas salegens]SDT98605.1 pilus assembly protein FimV [Halopseudomonas salegens]